MLRTTSDGGATGGTTLEFPDLVRILAGEAHCHVDLKIHPPLPHRKDFPIGIVGAGFIVNELEYSPQSERIVEWVEEAYWNAATLESAGLRA
jgi:hypothetical protein